MTFLPSPRHSGRASRLAVLLLLAFAACSRPAGSALETTHETTPEASASMDAMHAGATKTYLTADQLAGIAKVRQRTERFHAFAEARAAGYTNQYPAGCAASPLGGQGYHYLNPSLVDATVELLRPELVMYEPQRDGSLQLVGVDYVVPFTAWTSNEPPSLLGMKFGRNEPLGVWALHIWAWRPNAAGMFAMWNPSVSCAYAK